MQQHIPTSNKKKFYCNMIIKEETNLPVVVGNALELVSKELNHLAAILHVYDGGLNFMK